LRSKASFSAIAVQYVFIWFAFELSVTVDAVLEAVAVVTFLNALVYVDANAVTARVAVSADWITSACRIPWWFS